ncbi:MULTISPECIES: hypothetical protein [unclassified Vibrio]|uniref:hypothetical protein n=1 Tax=unclassified Vibrio TaxID=2614977 RepID=UPI001482FA8D|nr:MULTISPECIES: hypothetical protein [unclassified Vibrio]EGQ7740910.1 hypothetical protein [Vibrio parahaemolyticus]EJG1399010.1 hypothetical protein [Vibrio parahaemolyticus]MDF5393013.1 hypothetical protein [Vibrio parahaemolyticus]MDF5398961.1 hypothetical protein [Vibrio parahaemolyticus]MDW1981974.1 hypothetical protein [Vibrio sp. Vb0304]
MKYLFMVAFLLIGPAAIASGAVPEVPPFDWFAFLVAAFGEHGKVIAAWVSALLVVWSQVRQLIPPEWMAKLPNWLIDLLEFLAANKGKAANEAWNDPKHIKRVKT